MGEPQCSTDLTMTKVRPPKFLTGIERFYACARHTRNAGARAGGARCQPGHQTAYGLSREIWRDIRNLYFGITRHFSKIPLRGDNLTPGETIFRELVRADGDQLPNKHRPLVAVLCMSCIIKHT